MKKMLISMLIGCITLICSTINTARRGPVPLKRSDATIGKLDAFQAARTGDIKTLEIYLDAGIDVNGFNEIDETLLMVAADANQLDCAQLLLKHGANPNTASPRSMSALSRVLCGLHLFNEKKSLQMLILLLPYSTMPEDQRDIVINVLAQDCPEKNIFLQQRSAQTGAKPKKKELTESKEEL
jgi:ankyrin repeat protein